MWATTETRYRLQIPWVVMDTSLCAGTVWSSFSHFGELSSADIGRGHLFVWFRLRNPIAFFLRQSARVLCSWMQARLRALNKIEGCDGQPASVAWSICWEQRHACWLVSLWCIVWFHSFCIRTDFLAPLFPFFSFGAAFGQSQSSSRPLLLFWLRGRNAYLSLASVEPLWHIPHGIPTRYVSGVLPAVSNDYGWAKSPLARPLFFYSSWCRQRRLTRRLLAGVLYWWLG